MRTFYYDDFGNRPVVAGSWPVAAEDDNTMARLTDDCITLTRKGSDTYKMRFSLFKNSHLIGFGAKFDDCSKKIFLDRKQNDGSRQVRKVLWQPLILTDGPRIDVQKFF